MPPLEAPRQNRPSPSPRATLTLALSLTHQPGYQHTELPASYANFPAPPHDKRELSNSSTPSSPQSRNPAIPQPLHNLTRIGCS
ncbi:hypothetical protein ACLKA7_001694 [Drosophila subpalustris]